MGSPSTEGNEGLPTDGVSSPSADGARKCMHGTRGNTITNPCGNTRTPEAVDGGGTGADGGRTTENFTESCLELQRSARSLVLRATDNCT